jgi:hypothetical protein
MSAFSNLLIPAVLFFGLGFLARLIKSDLRFPQDMAKMMSIYLLMSIGLHGGYELGKAELDWHSIPCCGPSSSALLLPMLGYVLLLFTGKVDRLKCRCYCGALWICECRYFPHSNCLSG